MGGERCDFDWRQHSLNIPNKIHVNEFVNAGGPSEEHATNSVILRVPVLQFYQ